MAFEKPLRIFFGYFVRTGGSDYATNSGGLDALYPWFLTGKIVSSDLRIHNRRPIGTNGDIQEWDEYIDLKQASCEVAKAGDLYKFKDTMGVEDVLVWQPASNFNFLPGNVLTIETELNEFFFPTKQLSWPDPTTVTTPSIKWMPDATQMASGTIESQHEIWISVENKSSGGTESSAVRLQVNKFSGSNELQFWIKDGYGTQVETGNCTNVTPSTTVLQDSGQNFLTTVTVGDVVWNTTDNGYATVVSVDSDTQLTTTTLSSGDYSSGDAYTIDGGKCITVARANFEDHAITAEPIWSDYPREVTGLIRYNLRGNYDSQITVTSKGDSWYEVTIANFFGRSYASGDIMQLPAYNNAIHRVAFDYERRHRIDTGAEYNLTQLWLILDSETNKYYKCLVEALSPVFVVGVSKRTEDSAQLVLRIFEEGTFMPAAWTAPNTAANFIPWTR